MNTVDGLFQTLVAASSEASAALKYRNAFVDAIYWDTKPVAQTPYTGLNVNIPSVDESDVVDIQSGSLQPADTTHSTVQIQFNIHFSSSFVIKAWDAGRTPSDLKTMYIQPKLEGLLRKVNKTISNLVNTTNFSTYTLISGSGSDEIQRADLTAAWTNLADTGVPIEDTNNIFLIESTKSYGNQIGDANFINQYISGTDAAVAAQQQAKLKTQYGAEVRFDQHIQKFNSGKEPGIFMHRYAIAGVTAPPVSMGSPAIKETTFKLKGVLPVQLQMSAELKDQGWLTNVHCWWGVKVVRPEFATLLESA